MWRVSCGGKGLTIASGSWPEKIWGPPFNSSQRTECCQPLEPAGRSFPSWASDETAALANTSMAGLQDSAAEDTAKLRLDSWLTETVRSKCVSLQATKFVVSWLWQPISYHPHLACQLWDTGQVSQLHWAAVFSSVKWGHCHLLRGLHGEWVRGYMEKA